MTSEHQPEPAPRHEQGKSHPESEAQPTPSPGSGAGLVERAQRLVKGGPGQDQGSLRRSGQQESRSKLSGHL